MKFWSILAATCFATSAWADSYPDAKSVVSVGGPVTEIIYALGEQDRIVARDTTSVYPPAANELPDVGYMRRLSAEGVLALAPDLIIARETSGPPEALDLLSSARIPIVFIEENFDAATVIKSINTVGDALGVTEKSDALAADVSSALAELSETVSQVSEKKRVLFILSNREGRLNVAGAGTGANGIIELAGAVNVMKDAYDGYKIASPESIIETAPDVVVMMSGRGDHAGKKEEILTIAAISQTPAGENGAFVLVPGAALGFGPRTADLAMDFHKQLYEK